MKKDDVKVGQKVKVSGCISGKCNTCPKAKCWYKHLICTVKEKRYEIAILTVPDRNDLSKYYYNIEAPFLEERIRRMQA